MHRLGPTSIETLHFALLPNELKSSRKTCLVVTPGTTPEPLSELSSADKEETLKETTGIAMCRQPRWKKITIQNTMMLNKSLMTIA